MVVHRGHADKKPIGDLPARHPGADEPEDLDLPPAPPGHGGRLGFSVDEQDALPVRQAHQVPARCGIHGSIRRAVVDRQDEPHGLSCIELQDHNLLNEPDHPPVPGPDAEVEAQLVLRALGHRSALQELQRPDNGLQHHRQVIGVHPPVKILGTLCQGIIPRVPQQEAE
jgi:hypothetical protein